MSDTSHKLGAKHLSGFALSGLVLGAGGIGALAASGVGYRLGWWPVVTALTIAEWAVYVAALGLVVSVIGAVLSRPGARRRGFLLGLLGIAASLPVVAVAAQWEYATRTYPPINDISPADRPSTPGASARPYGSKRRCHVARRGKLNAANLPPRWPVFCTRDGSC